MLVYSTIGENKQKLRLQGIKCWLLDMDGTVSIGEDLIPGANRFFSALTNQTFVFVTNNSSHSAEHYVKRMNRIGIATKRENVLTSTDALILHLKKKFERTIQMEQTEPPSIEQCELIMLDNKKSENENPVEKDVNQTFNILADNELNRKFINPIVVFPVGTPDFEMELSCAGIEIVKCKDMKIDAVLIAFDTTLTYEKLDISCDYIRQGIPYYAANPDKVCPLADGKVLPDCGAILSFMRTCTGVEPEKIIGKPDAAMIDMILSSTGFKPWEIAMAGDRIYTDMAFAKNAGILSIAVLSGEATLDEIMESGVDPEFIFDFIGDVADYFV